MTGVLAKTDLRQLFGPVRDQGARPTCLAFAASDTHAALRDAWTPLSCEYVFYQAQRRANRLPNTGALLSSMLDALRLDGQPEENNWAYLDQTPLDATYWVPPAKVAPLFRRASESMQDSVDEVISELDKKRPVLVLMTLSRSFDMASVTDVVDLVAGEVPDAARRHAVIAVAHGVIKGQRAILIRNSWGAAWGKGGYAWLTEKYLLPRVFRLAILKEDLSVSAHSAAA
jgi:hypothetical protein